MENREIIDHIKDTLYDKAFSDIKKVLSVNLKNVAFILSSCFIDYMAGFLCGGKTGNQEYKDFVREYLKQYDADDLWLSLRCKLVHNYSEGGAYWLKSNQPQLHRTVVNDKTIINIENFIDDLESAFHQFMQDIQNDLSLQENAIKRYRKLGLLCEGGVGVGKE